MSTATITPLPGGKALFTLNGVEHAFPSTAAALDEATARGIPCRLERFPSLPLVLVESPALQRA